MTLPAVITAAGHQVDVTPLKGRSIREDWHVPATASTPSAIPNFVTELRRFFAEMDAEIDAHAADPIATSQALARMEAILADVRYLRDRLKDVTARSLDKYKVRRLVIDGIVALEAAGAYHRTEWQHQRLLTRVLAHLMGDDRRWIDSETGEVLEPDELAARLLPYFSPDWRLTPLRDAGIDPHAYCTVETGEDGKPVATPTVNIKDNLIRRNGEPT